MRFPSFMTFILILVISLPAFAGTIGPEGQKRLEAVFGKLLDQYKKTAETNGAKLMTEGSILVEPSETYYAITLPHITVKQPDGSYTEIGMISVNALPGDAPDRWNMTVALPTPIIHYDAMKKPLVTTTFGGQNFAGVWNEKFSNFTRLNAHYGNIEIRDHAEQTRILIPEAKLVYDMQETKPGLWSGPADFKLSDLQVYFDKDGSTARIGEVALKSKIEDYSLETAVAYQEKMNAIVESLEGGDAPSASPQSMMGYYNLIFDLMSSWSNFDCNLSVKNVALTRPAIPGSPPGLLKIANAAFGYGMAGIRSGNADLKLNFSYDGLAFAPLPANYSNAAPDHLSLSLGVNKLPFREMVEMGRSSLQSVIDNPAMGELAWLQVIATMPQLLTQARTNIALGKSSIGNEHYDVAADGVLTANMQATMGATGALNARIYGIDNLIAAMNAAAADPKIDEAKKKSIQDTLATLAIVKMAGQMDKDDKGRDIRTYKLELNQQGQAMLNGTDLNMLMQATQGSGAGTPAAP